MNHFVTLYVPSTKNVGQALDPAEHAALVERVERTFATAFGGCTVTTGFGSWVTESGNLVREQVTLVKSYHDTASSTAWVIATSLALAIKSEYGQEAIAIETETGIEFI